MLLLGILLISAAAAVAICAGIGAFATGWWLLWLPVSLVSSALLLTALAAAFLLLAAAVVDQEKEQQQDSAFYRKLTHLYIDFIMVIGRITLVTRGLEQTPKSGRFLLVCNHRNDIDPAVILKCFPDSQLAFISKRENKTMPIVGAVMHKLMCQLINRENDREALKTILKCIQLIKEDTVSVAVFPEGYIKPDGKLRPLKGGVFKIAQRANVPVVVCTLLGTKEALPRLLRLKPSQVELHLLGVIQPEEFRGITAVELANRVYRMMADDLGSELVYTEPAEN